MLYSFLAVRKCKRAAGGKPGLLGERMELHDVAEQVASLWISEQRSVMREWNQMRLRRVVGSSTGSGSQTLQQRQLTSVGLEL